VTSSELQDSARTAIYQYILLNTQKNPPAALRAAGFLKVLPMPMGSTSELESWELREEEE
jgi:hypothetical protein